MFFGSQHNMKSVTAAECAALAAFRILAQGDRVGGIVFGDQMIAEVRPQRSKMALNRFLKVLSEANGALRADAPNVTPVTMNEVLHAVARIAQRNHLLIFLSDFSEIDDQTRGLISGIARHNDVVIGLVSDPFDQELPEGAKLIVSDGSLQVAIDTVDAGTHQKLTDLAKGRLAEIFDWYRSIGVLCCPCPPPKTASLRCAGSSGFRPDEQ